jgi:hypothetical protein
MPDSITPSPELVTSLRNSAPHGIRDAGVTRELWLINHAYAAGANQELEACCEWLVKGAWFSPDGDCLKALRAARRAKPPSLKQQALLAIDTAVADYRLSADVASVVRRALEALDD